jgi:anti-sigma regulatory factor (Ser/Thr protein kinase)
VTRTAPSFDHTASAPVIKRSTLDLDRRDAACGQARRWARDVLADWAWPVPTDDIELIVSELVTNALLHARDPIRAHLTGLSDGSVRVCVDDGGPAHTPCQRDSENHGRGLILVNALAVNHGRVPLTCPPFRISSWATLAP